jgi:hypothetical protein
MKRSKAAKAIEKIALNEGVSTAEIRQNMQEAIDIAYANRDDSNADFWSQWQCKPSPEEFIIAANKEVVTKFALNSTKK